MKNDNKEVRVSISVIIPYYNVNKEFFKKCYESLLKQTFNDFEVIIIDDGSDRDKADYLDETVRGNSQFRIFHQSNGGVSNARNNGLSLAEGKAICFIDADDYFAPWMLEDLWDVYSKSNVIAVASYINTTDNDTFSFERNKTNVKYIRAEKMKDVTLIGMNCSFEPEGYLSAGPCAVLFNAELAKRVLFPADIRYMEDVIWNYRFFDEAKDAKVGVLKETVYAYRQNSQSASHKYNTHVVEDRIKSLNYMKKMKMHENKYFAIRAFSNYVSCCKSIMLTDEFDKLGKKLKTVKKMKKNSIWEAFKKKGVGKTWPRKMQIKRLLAISGLLPLAYVIKRK